MPLLTVAAIYFIIWWTVLFIVLPLGHRSQQEEGEITSGTVESAPARFRGGRVILLTTVISAVIYAAYYFISAYFGFGIANIPVILPNFD